jgi:hypothetical protein
MPISESLHERLSQLAPDMHLEPLRQSVTAEDYVSALRAAGTGADRQACTSIDYELLSWALAWMTVHPIAQDSVGSHRTRTQKPKASWQRLTSRSKIVPSGAGDEQIVVFRCVRTDLRTRGLASICLDRPVQMSHEARRAVEAGVPAPAAGEQLALTAVCPADAPLAAQLPAGEIFTLVSERGGTGHGGDVRVHRLSPGHPAFPGLKASAARFIPEGTVIRAVYGGKVLLFESEFRPTESHGCMYALDSNVSVPAGPDGKRPRLVYDATLLATVSGGAAPLMNSCKNNGRAGCRMVEMVLWREDVHGVMRAYASFFLPVAVRDIAPGEEVTWDYGDKYRFGRSTSVASNCTGGVAGKEEPGAIGCGNCERERHPAAASVYCDCCDMPACVCAAPIHRCGSCDAHLCRFCLTRWSPGERALVRQQLQTGSYQAVTTVGEGERRCVSLMAGMHMSLHPAVPLAFRIDEVEWTGSMSLWVLDTGREVFWLPAQGEAACPGDFVYHGELTEDGTPAGYPDMWHKAGPAASQCPWSPGVADTELKKLGDGEVRVASIPGATVCGRDGRPHPTPELAFLLAGAELPRDTERVAASVLRAALRAAAAEQMLDIVCVPPHPGHELLGASATRDGQQVLVVEYAPGGEGVVVVAADATVSTVPLESFRAAYTLRERPRRVWPVDDLVGQRVQKEFDAGTFKGRVVFRWTQRGMRYYRVLYDDGDSEDLSREEVQDICLLTLQHKDGRVRRHADARSASPEHGGGDEPAGAATLPAWKPFACGSRPHPPPKRPAAAHPARPAPKKRLLKSWEQRSTCTAEAARAAGEESARPVSAEPPADPDLPHALAERRQQDAQELARRQRRDNATSTSREQTVRVPEPEGRASRMPPKRSVDAEKLQLHLRAEDYRRSAEDHRRSVEALQQDLSTSNDRIAAAEAREAASADRVKELEGAMERLQRQHKQELAQARQQMEAVSFDLAALVERQRQPALMEVETRYNEALEDVGRFIKREVAQPAVQEMYRHAENMALALQSAQQELDECQGKLRAALDRPTITVRQHTHAAEGEAPWTEFRTMSRDDVATLCAENETYLKRNFRLVQDLEARDKTISQKVVAIRDLELEVDTLRATVASARQLATQMQSVTERRRS